MTAKVDTLHFKTNLEGQDMFQVLWISDFTWCVKSEAAVLGHKGCYIKAFYAQLKKIFKSINIVCWFIITRCPKL